MVDLDPGHCYRCRSCIDRGPCGDIACAIISANPAKMTNYVKPFFSFSNNPVFA